jgi:hypothetical protein
MASKHLRTTISILVVLGGISLISACASQTGQRAGQGAALGAVSGAAGGVVSALIFGGDVGEAAARGAAWGGSMGAVGGALTGMQQDSAIKKQQEDAAAKLKQELGDDAFNGLVALANCKHDVAAGHANTAKNLDNRKFALAGQWLEVLTLADQRKEDKARVLFPVLIEKDPEINSEAKAEENMRSALQGLMQIRAKHNLPKTCN